MKKLRDRRGITLIALVITIIVLLILTGVTIITLTGENGILSKAKNSKEISNEANARENVKIKVLEYITHCKSKNETATLEGIKEYYKNDNQIEYIDLYIETSSLVPVETGQTATRAKIKLNEYKYIYILDEKLNIIDSDVGNSGNNQGNGEDDNEKSEVFGDTDNALSEIVNSVNSDQYDITSNVFDYRKGARVTYVNSTFRCSATEVNGGYTGINSPIGNTEEAFWKDGNGWNVQGCVENDCSIDNISYNHLEKTKSSDSATTISGDNTQKQTIIIDPRSFYGDTQNYIFEIDDLYLASANSDGDVGDYSIYISNGNSNVSTNPSDPSWEFITQGTLNSVGKLEKIYSGNLKFKYIKLEIYSKNKSYMELAAIKGFKKSSDGDTTKIMAKKEGDKLNVIAVNENVGIKEIKFEKPSGMIISSKMNYYRIYKNTYNITKNGIYKITVIDKNENSKLLEINISSMEEKDYIYAYEGNLFNYKQGTRVTYVTNKYNCSGYSVNDGYTGENTPLGNENDSFWLPQNGWSVQGCLENNDSKISMDLNHNEDSKSKASSTTLNGRKHS